MGRDRSHEEFTADVIVGFGKVDELREGQRAPSAEIKGRVGRLKTYCLPNRVNRLEIAHVFIRRMDNQGVPETL